MQKANKTVKTHEIIIERLQPDQIRAVRRAASKKGNEALLEACYDALHGDTDAYEIVAKALLTAAARTRYLHVTTRRGRVGIRSGLDNSVWYPGQAATALMQSCDNPALLARYFAVFEPRTMGLVA